MIVPSVLADGGMMHYYQDKWQMLPEGQQLAAINYKDGYENLILAVEPGEGNIGDKAVWIFPVPAKPSSTVINIGKGFPVFQGQKLSDAYDAKVDDIMMTSISTQFFLLPLMARNFMGKGSAQFGATLDSVKLAEGVTVHESITKFGITTELITAEDGASLAEYLSAKSLEIPPIYKSILDEYIGKEYSFVISWVDDMQGFKQSQFEKTNLMNQGGRYYDPYGYNSYASNNMISVFITFPTDKLYFPLKPTSVYGSLKVPATIYIVGYVKPEFYPMIKPDAQVEYFVGTPRATTSDMNDFFFSSPEGVGDKYTIIKLNPPSKFLSQDLWIKTSSPVGKSFTYFFYKNAFIFGLLLIILLSCIASMLAGLILYRKSYLKWWHFALFGLFNLLTILGFILATLFLRTKEITKPIKDYVSKNASSIFLDPRKKYNAYLIGMGIAILLWLVLGRVSSEGMNVLLFFIFFIFILFSIFFLSREKIKGKAWSYFTKNGYYLKVYNLRKMISLAIFNFVGSFVLLFILNISYQLKEDISQILAFGRYGGSYYNNFYGTWGSLELLVVMIVFALSILIIALSPGFFDNKKDARGLFVTDSDYTKVPFVILFSVFFIVLNILLYILLITI